MAELHRGPPGAGNQREEVGEPAQVLPERGWALEQGRAKAVPQDVDRAKEVVERAVFVGQPIDVRDPAGGFEHEAEPGGHLVGPLEQHVFPGDAVERVVDLDRREPAGVEAQHVVRRQVGGVEAALPFLVGPAAGPDVKLHGEGAYRAPLAFFFGRSGSSLAALVATARALAGRFSSDTGPRLARLAFRASIRSMILVWGASLGSEVISCPSTFCWIASSTRSRTVSW